MHEDMSSEFIYSSKLKDHVLTTGDTLVVVGYENDIEKFKKFKVDYTLKWNDDLDLAPEYLYFKAFETDNSLKTKFQGWGYI